ncbi:unnamed protein product [Clonostachys byssicola]|uniref:Uncharacterized protein n=1 Tax=Clonostachys byssicola TaxID=160290 RepID=A0A9N9UFP4_9HYPO|nr:unnamed protein product [Clonostachys byssicola]
MRPVTISGTRDVYREENWPRYAATDKEYATQNLEIPQEEEPIQRAMIQDEGIRDFEEWFDPFEDFIG